MSQDILIIAEHEDDKLKRSSLEALVPARRLAEASGGQVVAVLLGRDPGALAAELADRGADRAIAASGEHFEPYTPEAYQEALRALIEKEQPRWVLAGHSYRAIDFLPGLAARFDAAVASDCSALETGDGEPVWVRQPYDAKLNARVRFRGEPPWFATTQIGAFPADDLPTGHGGQVESAELHVDAAALKRKVLEIKSTGDKAVNLGAAEVIVAGGRGFNSQEKFQMAHELAELLGGAVGASRPVCDNEWLPHEYQIGSSGQTVAPKLYIGIGVSGAIQHVVGMRGSGTVVAINKDPEAPIFNEADYWIVGDLFEIVPELLQAIREAKEQ
jgi:electron transfer flavoprotein alpha subunit